MQHTVAQENSLPGTLDWQMTRFRFDSSGETVQPALLGGLRSSAIEGYASRTSVYPGETIDFMVSVEPVCRFAMDIYRLGYYGGTGGRHICSLGTFSGETQPVPVETVERLRECNWQPSATLQVPDHWASGVYLVKLTSLTPFRAQSYIVFIVKQRQKADILVQASDLTWQAYNKWPGLNSIYDDGTPQLWYMGPNVRVSFDRPYSKYCQIVDSPLSCGSGSFLLWEFPLAYWLEAEGYNVAYCSNLDLHDEPGLIESCKVFISVGHDEYWTRTMYDNAVAARDAGVSLLFLSGNSINHDIIPYDNQLTGERFRAFARKERFLDEFELMGATTFGPGYGDWTVSNPDHWVFEGTGMKAGDSIPGLVGWEYHGAPFKQIAGLELLAHSELIGVSAPSPKQKHASPRVGDGKHAAVIYPGPRNNWVFNAGTIWWAQGLSSPPGHIPAKGLIGRVQGPDPRVQRMTRNLLDRCIGQHDGAS
jgi:hypothetical protein